MQKLRLMDDTLRTAVTLTAAVFAALCMVFLLCGLLPWRWPLLFIQLFGAAGLWCIAHLMKRRLLHDLPREGTPLSLDAALFLTGGLRVHTVLAPEEPTHAVGTRSGPSMLLLAHAAALLSDSGTPQAQAVVNALRDMRVDAALMRSRVTEEADFHVHGLVWRAFREGDEEYAFCCGSPAAVIPACQSILYRTPQPFTPEAQEAMLDRLAAERLLPICAATARLHEGALTDITFLGTFCFEEEVRADAAVQADLIRSAGSEPMIFSSDAAVCGLVCAAAGCERTEVPLHCHHAAASAGEAPADACLRAAKLRARIDSFFLQLSLLMELPGFICLLLGLAPLTASAVCLLPLPLMVLCAMPNSEPGAALDGKMLRRLALQILISSMAALGTAAYARGCGLSGDGVFLITLAPLLVYAAYGCIRQLRQDSGSLGYAPPAALAAVMLLLALSMGAGAAGFGFGLMAGLTALIPGVMLLKRPGKHREK